MRILHSADWHLGKKLDNFSRIEEQQAVMQEICEIAEREQVNAVIVAGDVFDNYNPSTEAVDLLYKTLKRLANNGQRAVIVIAGNHDSPDRIQSPDPLARECGIIFIGFPNSVVPIFSLESSLKVLKSVEGFIELKLPACVEPLRVVFTPYANELRLKSSLGVENSEAELRHVLEEKWKQHAENHCDSNGVNILIAHLFLVKHAGFIPEESGDEKPILFVGGAQAVYSENIPNNIHYTALGHLHRKQIIDISPCPIVYSGSPLPYSFAEENQKKYVMIIDVNSSEAANLKEVELLQGKKLLCKSAESIDDAVIWLKLNQSALVSLTMVTDTYLTADDRRQLNEAHSGIISIIPELKNSAELPTGSGIKVDPRKNIEELFVDYFKHKSGGQNPNDRLLDLFKEMMSAEVLQ